MNLDFTLRTNPLKRVDLEDFVACYRPENRQKRRETEHFKCVSYDDLLTRGNVNLDISWLRIESLEDSANLPDPDVIAAESAGDLQTVLDKFSQIASDLKPTS